MSKLFRGRFRDIPCAGVNASCQPRALVRVRGPFMLFVFCPLRADRFVGADTSSRSCIARYVLGTACYARKSDTFFRIELACLGPRLASAELIRARTDGKTSARFEIFAAKRESRREKASLAPACVARPAHQSFCGARRRGRCAAERPGRGTRYDSQLQ